MSQNQNTKPQSSVVKIPKIIIWTGQFLQFFSLKWAAKFAAKLFITPVKYPMPKREQEMFNNSVKKDLWIEDISKTINTYHYGTSNTKVLLVHGWSGRGTQMVKIANAMIKEGFSVVSFDAPAHGISRGRTTMMNEFVSSIHEIDKQFGPFDFAIGHSLGGISLLNSINQGFTVKKLITIGAGNSITEIGNLFIGHLKLKKKVSEIMKSKFDALFKEDIEIYSSYMAAKGVKIPVLLLHDEDDEEIPVKAVHEICKELSNGTTHITQGLGHRKILGDSKVIAKIVEFLKN